MIALPSPEGWEQPPGSARPEGRLTLPIPLTLTLALTLALALSLTLTLALSLTLTFDHAAAPR